MTSFLFTSDLHGNVGQYRAAFRSATDENVASIVIGGDIAPYLERSSHANQRAFLEETLPRLVERECRVPLFLMLGNDDAAINLDLLERRHGALWQHMQGRRLPFINGYEIVGYPWVPISPFGIKDYEKFDHKPRKAKKGVHTFFSGEEIMGPGASLDGWVSMANGWHPIHFDTKRVGRTIEEDLQDGLFTDNPAKTVCCFHSPPYGGPLDVIGHPLHVGSRAIAEFIEQRQPAFALSGHIHETVEMSSIYAYKIGTAVCAAAGNDPRSDRLAYLIVGLGGECLVERKTVPVSSAKPQSI